MKKLKKDNKIIFKINLNKNNIKKIYLEKQLPIKVTNFRNFKNRNRIQCIVFKMIKHLQQDKFILQIINKEFTTLIMIIFLIHNKILKYKKKLIQLVTYVNLLRQKGRTG